MTLTFLKNLDQLFHRMFLIFVMSDCFLMSSSRLDIFGRNAAQVSCGLSASIVREPSIIPPEHVSPIGGSGKGVVTVGLG